MRKFLRFHVNKWSYQFTSPVWAGYISKRIYQAPATGSAAIENARGPSTCLSGRLVDPGGLARDGQFPCAASHESAASSGMDHQVRDIKTNLKTGIRFHWNSFSERSLG